ncbi:unnamed protein product [Vicia faba]|uniref:Uncharacterized protein n=1 Tax=Vicia faba TaxID=3906 RepID=A0AAV1A758_VICFA|nr:unnamed protein product [Vicia faba]
MYKTLFLTVQIFHKVVIMILALSLLFELRTLNNHSKISIPEGIRKPKTPKEVKDFRNNIEVLDNFPYFLIRWSRRSKFLGSLELMKHGDAEVPWHLIAIAIFFTLIKLPGPYYPYWGRILIPQFANGVLLRALWLQSPFQWKRKFSLMKILENQTVL